MDRSKTSEAEQPGPGSYLSVSEFSQSSPSHSLKGFGNGFSSSSRRLTAPQKLSEEELFWLNYYKWKNESKQLEQSY